MAHVRAISAEVVSRGFAPGIATQLYCDGKPLLVETIGFADLARKRLLVDDDLFRIYSMTKPLTSLAAMILVDEKRLMLDDPVAKYLPEFSTVTVYESGETPEAVKTVNPTRELTIRDLLRHTAGMTYLSSTQNAVSKMYVQRGIDHGGGNTVVPADGSVPISNIGEFTHRLATIPLLYQPGEHFSYGNATDVLAAVIERASGHRYREFMAARVFKPLKMDDTFFDVPKEKIGRLTAAYGGKSIAANNGSVFRSASMDELGHGTVAQVEDPQKSVFSEPRYIDFGGAGLVSTARDYQRFLTMLLNDGFIDGVRVVSVGTVAEMTRNHLGAEALATPYLAKQGLGFGLGFARFLDPAKAPVAVPKNGYFWGGAASTYFWVDPDRRISGVVMTQVFGGDVTPFYLEILNTLYRPSEAKNESEKMLQVSSIQ
ncbi:MAG: beta-lactamase family protein [Rhodocyclaceae bacterium]|nr:beta-lactamase family protein [Rhodocyclaceae bacterium]